MNNSMKFLIDKNDSEERLDVFLSNQISHLTRSHIKKIIELGQVEINKKPIKKEIKYFCKYYINLIIKNPEKLFCKKNRLRKKL